MTFFEGQALARRNTRLLVILYLLAVIAVIAAVDLVLATSWIYGVADAQYPKGARPGFITLLTQVPAFVYVSGAAVTSAVILGVSGYEVWQLADGGDKVAEMVGARRVSPETRDPLEKRLLNVVDEMSIASGVRLPKVYIMDGERGINAFAAGYDISNSVVAVTRGTLETLNRDELQAVIAHEFSHILNGDMRLNIRMMGVLAGIVFIGAIGEFLMRSVSNSRSRDGGVWALFAAGLGLLVIGYAGLFFARLIKAAVSRQREFLADASSVQFTRNPDGIAGALDQIAGGSALIENRRAEDMSHMFFGQGISVWFGGLFDTHPPVAQRIRLAHPRFDAATYRKSRAKSLAPAVDGAAIGTDFGPAAAGFAGGRRTADIGQEWGRSAGESAAVVGTVDAGKLDYARALIAGLPAQVKDRIHEADGACAVIVALLLARKEEVMNEQLAAAKAAGAEALADAARALAPATRRLGAAFHLPLIDLALPAAQTASPSSREALLAGLKAVIEADRRVSLHEFVVLTLVRKQLAPAGRPGAAGNRRLGDLRDAALILLRLAVHAGTREDAAGERQQQVESALRAGMQEMGLAGAQLPAGPLSMEAAGAAIESLNSLAPMQTALLVKGLFAAVTSDGTIRVMEAELMRMVCAALDCPLPPLLTDVDPATLAA